MIDGEFHPISQPLHHSALAEQLGAKPAFDVCAALILLLTLVPLFAAIAVAVLTTSAGRVIYSQDRVRHHGRQTCERFCGVLSWQDL